MKTFKFDLDKDYDADVRDNDKEQPCVACERMMKVGTSIKYDHLRHNVRHEKCPRVMYDRLGEVIKIDGVVITISVPKDNARVQRQRRNQQQEAW